MLSHFRANLASSAIATLSPLLMLVSTAGCATRSEDTPGPQLKSEERPLHRDDLKERTKPEPPVDRPKSELRVEPLHTA